MKTKEIVVISGKGGTGKTTLVASLVPYLNSVVLADCDVDAPDLKILFSGENKTSEEFIGLKRASIDKDKCIKCGKCREHCKFKAFTEEIDIIYDKCEGCGVCEYVCPVNAIELKDSVVGHLYTRDTEYGSMAHARLIPGEETSGKLVARVRKEAKLLAEKTNAEYIIIDGSPGIACNVISSITGTDKVIIVIEPTLSGLHDLEKVHRLINRFNLPIYVVINKSDLSNSGRKGINDYCLEHNLNIALEIPFEENIVKSIVNKQIPSLEEVDFFRKIGFIEFVDEVR
ncbi:MAG: ATP-binding protein [Tissierellales bacterium]|jgi:MinD superfamily P-loop ATPase|nr:ATP-binding protein [Tissierellales bacterium]